VAQIDIPAINADMNLYNFRKLPFFRILAIVGGVCDKTYSEEMKEYVSLHEVNYRVAASVFESEWLPAAGNLPAMSFTLQHPKEENDRYDNIQIFIEPKGGHLVANDSWKQNFMLRLKDESIINFSTHVGDYHIWGMPFYTEQNVIEFDREFKKEFVTSEVIV